MHPREILTQDVCTNMKITNFPQFHGVLKLLTSNYEKDGEVDTRVKSRLQLKSLSVPAGREAMQNLAFILL